MRLALFVNLFVKEDDVSMLKLNKICTIFVGFMIALILALPLAAHAQTTTTTSSAASTSIGVCAPGGAYGQVDTTAQQAFQSGGWGRLQTANNAMGIYGSVNIKTAYCLQGLQNLYNFLANLASPVDPLVTVIVGVTTSLIVNTMMSIMNAVCQATMSAVQSLQNMLTSALNTICIPIPHFGLSLGFKTSLGPPCAGIGLGTLMTMPQYTPVAVPSYQTIIPKSSQ